MAAIFYAVAYFIARFGPVTVVNLITTFSPIMVWQCKIAMFSFIYQP